ncbi:MAG TPA: sugar phosphate nucleotidyltransferase [Bdellovibrionota bacterium]|jgi:NDP-sugar pyrophosphorylase family protein|nr:sugar phosphate nucleotidyltransferase [Bdellovibrionota bacterium]
MQVVILAGGKGTRIASAHSDVPKNLIPVAGRPFADYQLGWLSRQGATDVIYSIGHLGDQIRAFVGDGSRWNLRVRYAEEGTHLKGTGGALSLAHELGLLAPAFCVLYGDSFLPVKLAPIWETFEAAGTPALMTVLKNEGRWDRGNAELKNGKVLYDKSLRTWQGKMPSHIDYGLSILTDSVISGLDKKAEPWDLAELFFSLSTKGQVTGYEVHDRFFEIGSLEGLRDFESWVKANPIDW